MAEAKVITSLPPMAVPSGAFMTKDSKLGDWKRQDFILSQSGDQKSEIKVWAGPPLSGGSKRGSFLPLPASGGPRHPWLVSVSFYSFPLSSHDCLFSVCVYVFVAKPPSPLSYKDISHWVQVYPYPVRLQLHQQRPCFQIRSHLLVPSF